MHRKVSISRNELTSRRSSKVVHGGRRVPRTDRPVRQREVKTYFPVGSIGVIDNLRTSKSVGCLASGPNPL